MGISRKASARWEGDLKSGQGSLTTPDSGLLEGTAYGFNSRFGDGRGTNPEELIAAAQAGCFSMYLALQLTEAGHPPRRLDTRCEVDLDPDAGPALSAIRLTLQAEVPGIDEATFERLAADARDNCPVSRALQAVPKTMDATLRKA